MTIKKSPQATPIDRGPAPDDTPSDLICWTRMQAEAGQTLEEIIYRKELERQAGQGLFFWGIGNALNFPQGYLETLRPVPIIYSRMLSRPREVDRAPTTVTVWRKYIDSSGRLRALPPHVLVTSRSESARGIKLRHYALVCRSTMPLKLHSQRSFDPSAYRNFGPQGREVGFSQVTALLRRVSTEKKQSKYAVDMQAELVSPYFVRLADPAMMRQDHREILRNGPPDMACDWLGLTSTIRSSATELEFFLR